MFAKDSDCLGSDQDGVACRSTYVGQSALVRAQGCSLLVANCLLFIKPNTLCVYLRPNSNCCFQYRVILGTTPPFLVPTAGWDTVFVRQPLFLRLLLNIFW